jgi:hypothetical protein
MRVNNQFTRLLTVQYPTTVGRTPLADGLTGRRDLYLTTQQSQDTADILCPGRHFFVSSCTLYFILNCYFVLVFLHFAFWLYLQHATQTSMPPSGFELATPKSDRPQILASHRLATGIGIISIFFYYIKICSIIQIYFIKLILFKSKKQHICTENTDTYSTYMVYSVFLLHPSRIFCINYDCDTFFGLFP